MKKAPQAGGCGAFAAVEEVDLIQPFKGVNDPLRLDLNNLQSL
jgi:hypothetical protein